MEANVERSLLNEKCDVFLSYSHDDRQVVEQIAAGLKQAGLSCWIDKDELRANAPYNEEIVSGIDAAKVFIAFLSKSYVQKPYCAQEFSRAIDQKKSIMDVCVDDVTEQTNRNSSYMFAFCAGHSILGYGTGIRSAEDIQVFVSGIVDSITIQELLRYQKNR